MYSDLIRYIFITVAYTNLVSGRLSTSNVECGPYGFVCEQNKVRLCDGNIYLGPAFLCPGGTICNEESTDVCENAINYIDPVITRSLRCRRHERVADPSVAGCKGYILCVPNGARFQGIKFKCSGNTIFNSYSRSCTSPQRYKCPVENVTVVAQELYSDNRKGSNRGASRPNPDLINIQASQHLTPIECKNYKFRVTQASGPGRATYFCPSRPVNGESSVRCTIFSNQFCITLQRDDENQFFHDSSLAYRRPRM